MTTGIDGFQTSMKRSTSGGQMRNEKAAVQRTFHFERNSIFLFFGTGSKDLM